jgi:hypothetical protein
MKIANPWPRHPHIRFTCKLPDGEIVGTCGAGPEIDIPDGCLEAMIEPINKGHSTGTPVDAGRIWSREWGSLDVADHLKKMELAKEVKKSEEKRSRLAEEKLAAKKLREDPRKEALEKFDENFKNDPNAKSFVAKPGCDTAERVPPKTEDKMAMTANASAVADAKKPKPKK